LREGRKWAPILNEPPLRTANVNSSWQHVQADVHVGRARSSRTPRKASFNLFHTNLLILVGWAGGCAQTAAQAGVLDGGLFWGVANVGRDAAKDRCFRTPDIARVRIPTTRRTVPTCMSEMYCNGLCKFFAMSQVDNGRYGDVKFDGVKFGIAGEFLRKVIGESPKKIFTAYYIDSGASAEQREALRKLFTGPSFAAAGQAAEVKELAINFENLDAFGQVGKPVSATMGEIATVKVTPIAGGTDPNKPMAVENEAEAGLKWTALGKISACFYRSAGKDYKFDGTSGESHRFAWKGGGEK
jgi:hypothetical protein